MRKKRNTYLSFILGAIAIGITTAITIEWKDYFSQKRKVHPFETIIVAIVASFLATLVMWQIFRHGVVFEKI